METDYMLTPEARAIAEAMMADIDGILYAPLPPDEALAEPDSEQIERMAAERQHCGC